MKAFLSAVLVALVVAAVSGAALVYFQEPVYERYVSESVRIGDPGHNLLVGGGPREGGNERARD